MSSRPVVVLLGVGLVLSSPLGTVEDGVGFFDPMPGDLPQQLADLGDGQRDQVLQAVLFFGEVLAAECLLASTRSTASSA